MRIRHWIAWGLVIFVILGVGGMALGFRAAGYEKYIVETGSMVPELKPGDLIIDKPASAGYQVGDVITFRHGEGADLVTHRIIDITPGGIKTKGDANPTADVWTIPSDFVQGVLAFNIPKGGFVVLFLSQPAGIGAILLVIVGLVLLWRVFFPTEPAAASENAQPTVAETPQGEAIVDSDTSSTIDDSPEARLSRTSNVAGTDTGASAEASGLPSAGRHSAF